LVVNLGTGTGHSVLDVVRETAEATGRSIPYRIVPRRPGDPASLWASGEKAQTLLGWEPRHSSLRTIVETTWKAYQANGLA